MNILKKAIAVIAISMLLPLFMSTAAQAQTSHHLYPGSGGQLQIGTGLPLPIQVFTLGQTPGEAQSYPPLQVPVKSVGLATVVSQNATGKITVPANALSFVATQILKQPTYPTNNSVWQVNTAIDFRFPSAAASFAPGSGPAAIPGSVFIGSGPGGGSMTYTKTSNAFGGSARWAVNGSTTLSGGGANPGQPVTVYINAASQTPGTGNFAAIVGASVMGAEAGAPGTATATTPGVAAANGSMGGAFGPNGTVLASFPCPQGCALALTNKVQGDKGFPWTTGMLTVAQGVVGETFYLSGTDTRPGGVGSGNITMVSGTLSQRQLSGPNANRGWVSLTLPEPTAMAGAAGALLMLGVCHNVVRRRR